MRLFFTLLCLAFSLFSFSQSASISASVNAGCSPLLVTFDGTASTGQGPLSYEWDFGNGNTSSGSNQQAPGAIYSLPGTYQASLRVVDANGNASSTVFASITVYPNPDADFLATNNIGCPPLTVQFTDQSASGTGNIIEWIWDFGDGNSSTLENPNHTYPSGTYPVSLIVKDANGCTDIQVYPGLVEVEAELNLGISINGSRLSCDPTLSTQFIPDVQTSGTGPFTYLWDFGDGTTSTDAQPNKTYTAYGLYSVSLTVADQSTGCSNTYTEADYIRLIDTDLDIGLTPGQGCNPSVQLSNLSTILQPDFIATWYFGDGDSLRGLAMAPSILNPVHTYAQSGSYNISLKLDMGNGVCIETFTLPNPVLVEGAPAVDFGADNQTACTAPLTVNFTSTALRAVSWQWDFGDGNTSTLANPQHTYMALGRYDVSLTITDANGCTNTIQKDDFILVEEAQAAFAHNLNDFTVFPDLWDGRDPSVIRGGCLPLPIDFTDQSYAPTPIVSWEWNFGDGNTLNGTDANPQHTYTMEGEFTVSLTITTLDGCVSTVSCDSCIRAGNKPTALLDTSAYPLLQCCSASTLFQNATDPNTHDYVWYSVTTGDWDGFEVNDTSNGNWDFGSTVPVFRDSGQFVSTMFYTYNKGCVDSFYLDKWTMLRPPYASGGIDFFPCETNWPPGGTVIFDTSNTLYLLDTAYIDSVEWTFPGGVTSNEFYPSFTFPDTGAYWIGVTVWNYDNGCSCRTSGEQILQIIAQPDTTFMLMPPAGCSPLEVSFTGPTTNVSSWQWNLGGGITSTDPNPVFNLDSLGSYDVSLIVSNAGGCKDTVFRPDAIQVNGIVPRIDLSQDIACLPLNLTLSDQSSHTAPIVSRVWELGDGTVISGNDSVLTHLYDSMLVEPQFQLDGIPVILTLTDSTGCSASDTAYLRLIQPIASYLTDTVSICQGDSLFLTGLGGDSLAISSLTYNWEFIGANPNTANGEEVISFFGAGTDLSVRLTVTDSLGCADRRIDTFDVVPDLPTANFEAFPTGAVCPPLVVNFTDLSQPGNAPITEWLWDFGDGTQSRLQNPIKIFSDFDSYDISLIVTDSLGCSNSFVIPDLVQLTGVQGGFTMNTNVICAFDSILFTANSPNAGSYTWDFGDGTIGVGRVVTHPYNEAGLNIPTLILEDSTGTCSVSISDTLIVNPIPPLNMPADTSFCEGGVAVFDVFETGAEYRWNTGETTPSISANQSGIFRVVISYPGTGCSNTDEVELIVQPNPVVNIEGPVELCEGDTLLLYAETPNTLNIINWNFNNLGSGGPDSLRIALGQSEEVRVEVRDQNNCPAEDSLFVTVIPYPEIDLSYDPLCLGDTLLLDATPPNIQDPSATFFWWKDQEPLGNLGPVISVTEEGSYELAYYLRGCLSEFGAEIFFNPLPESNIYEEQLNCVYKGQFVTLDAGDAFEYNWLHTGESSRFVEVVAADTYYVEVFNEFRCSVLDSTAVIDACPPLLYVPTAFSPNGDGVNEEFAWGGDYLADFQMQIFSRWGMLLYETRDPAAFWDGRFKGQQVQEGVYTWIVRYNGTHPDYQKIFQRAGTVTVFR